MTKERSNSGMLACVAGIFPTELAQRARINVLACMCIYRNSRMCAHNFKGLTHIYMYAWRPFCGTQANRLAPDLSPQNAASYLGLFCLLT